MKAVSPDSARILSRNRFVRKQSPWRSWALVAGLCATLLGCRRSGLAPQSGEVAYVSGATAELRNELGPASKVIAHFRSGERVEVLSRRPRWAEVRRPGGETGWVLQRFLVSQDLYDRFAKLYREAEVLPAQGRATLRREGNLHLEPGRTTQSFYQLAEGEPVEVVGHRVVDREAPSAAAASSDDGGSVEGANASLRNPEDWLLVRATGSRAGWLLESSADPAPPIEIAQYSEGLRIRAWFELYRDPNVEPPHPWYLWATVRRLAGLPYDFDEIRVFVWDPKSSRYETSYREQNLTGFFPIVVGSQDSPGGPAPTFHFEAQDSGGQRVDRKYFMVGRQVRLER
jgi:Bacterial SH3 domain